LTLIAVGASRFTLKMDFSKTEDPLPQKETEP